jgi:hypothetical protein
LSYDKKAKDGKVERVAAKHLKVQFNRRTTLWMLRRSGLGDSEILQLIKASRSGDHKALNNALKAAECKGIQRITRYTLRRFMATRVHGLAGSKVGREQRSLWLGHGKRDATRHPCMKHTIRNSCANALRRLYLSSKNSKD